LVSPDETAVNVVMHLVGTTSRALGFAVGPAIVKTTKGFLEELRKDCEAAWSAPRDRISSSESGR